MFNKQRGGSGNRYSSHGGASGSTGSSRGGDGYRKPGSGGGSSYRGKPEAYQQQTQQQMKNRDAMLDQAFQKKYGKTKSELLDSWLEMDHTQLASECTRMGLTPTPKHIENIQNLFDHLKKIENEFEAQSGSGSSQASSSQAVHSQQHMQQQKEFIKPVSQPSSSSSWQSSSSNTQSSSHTENLFKKMKPKSDGSQQSSQPGQANAQGGGGSGKNFFFEQEKARENLNEQLARILNKRKGLKSEEQAAQQSQSISFGKQRATGGAAEVSFGKDQQSQLISNPFSFGLSSLKKALEERGPFSKTENSAQLAQFQHAHGDSTIIDRIFEMGPEQLDAHFKNYTSPESGSTNVFTQMSLKQEEFEKLPSITKKKVLINMTGVRQTIAANPNPLITEQRMSTIKPLVNFTKENWLFLNPQSKSLLGEQLSTLLKSKGSELTLRGALMGSPQLQADLVKVASDLLPKESNDLLKSLLTKIYVEENEHIFQDATLEQAPTYAKVVKYLSPQPNAQGDVNYAAIKLQSYFYTGVRKVFTKRNIKQLSFDDQLAVLEALPPIEGDAISQMKSLHYMLLTEILSPNQKQKDLWGSLSKGQIMKVAQKATEMSGCRDISNMLRGALLSIQTHEFSFDDFYALFKMLANENGVGSKGSLDVKLFSTLMMRRNTKTSAMLMNASDATELRKHFEFFEFMYKQNPISFAFAPNELKLMLGRVQQLALEQHLPMQEMVHIAKVMVPSLYKPAMLFNEMIKNTNESFKTGVDKGDLYELVEQIIQRAKDGEIGFEHLQLSNSRMHKSFKPHTEKSVILLNRILNDLTCNGNLTREELKIANKILSNMQMSELLFKTSDEAQKILDVVVDSQLIQFDFRFNELMSKPFTASFNTEASTNNGINVDFKEWIETFQAFSSIALLSTAPKGIESPIKEKMITQVAPKAFNIIREELFKAGSFPVNRASVPANQEAPVSSIDHLFKLNKAILDFLENSGEVATNQYYQSSQVREIVSSVLESQFLNKKPFILAFEKYKKSIRISKMIQMDTNKELIIQNAKEIIQYMNNVSGLEGSKEIAKEFSKTILPYSRSIVGKDLVNLFKMIDKYSITEDVRALIANVAPNLMTIESQKIYDYSSVTGQTDPNFALINEKLSRDDQANKIMILKKYEMIYHQQPELLKKPEASLSPLSYLMSEVLDQYTDEEVLMCLEMLGSEKVENYHEEFIKKLYERYQSSSVIDNMATNNQKFFLKFAKLWPHFLKNNAMLNQLISMGKQSSTLVKQQSETLHILARKNVLHPELLENHLETFMKMKDRERVAEYLQEYLHSAAFLGHTGINTNDMHRITQLFRRLYKTPDQVPEVKQLLDYLIVLALSNSYYKDFDAKSIDFVEDAINLVEKRFTGLETLEIPAQPHPVSGEVDEENKLKLNYFKSITSNSKIYNKVLSIYSQEYREGLNFKRAFKDLGKDVIVVESEDEEVEEESPVKKGGKAEAVVAEAADEVEDPLLKKIEEEEDDVTKEEGTDPHEFHAREDIDADLHAAVHLQHKKDAEAAAKEGKHVMKERKIYERKASESLYSEELEFHQFRKKKLQDLDKKSKHLLLFSNINQLNFVDVNQNDLVKAWAVLFHFRSKSFDSIIYDEFESITMRNAIGKSKGHELFSKFYLKLIEASYNKGFRMHLTSKCEKTGWPIDISINSADQGNELGGGSYSINQRKKLALYFFLQEEVCLNANEQSEEPLGLQKLMLKHLQNISDYKVEYVTENDFYMNKDTIESYVDYLLSEKLLAKGATSFSPANSSSSSSSANRMSQE